MNHYIYHMKTLLVLLSCGICFGQFQSAYAQSSNDQNPTLATLNHVALHVVDLEKSTAFYQDLLKLTVIPEPFNDGMHTWFSMGETSELHLISGAKQLPEPDKFNHLCFSVKSMDDFIKTIQQRGIPYSDFPGKANTITLRPDGVRQLYLQDPDGYWIEINDAIPAKK